MLVMLIKFAAERLIERRAARLRSLPRAED
jgi:hypothetical protein